MKTKPIEEWYPEKIRTGATRIGTEVLEKRRRSKISREERVGTEGGLSQLPAKEEIPGSYLGANT
jgi:hypothetical protein